jgi:hypothetical protein
MLRLLLDEHISLQVARGLRRAGRGLAVHAITEWHGGDFLGQPVETCLRAAASENLTLVTYERRTIPPLLKAWAESGEDHGGVIFVDEKTISPADIGGLVKALQQLAREGAAWDWSNRVVFFRH